MKTLSVILAAFLLTTPCLAGPNPVIQSPYTTNTPAAADAHVILITSLYSAPTIASFNNNQNSVEVGTTISSTILSWTLSGASITRQSLDNSIGSVALPLRGWTNSASYTANRTYTLTVTDGVKTNTAATSVAFYSKAYWGASGQTASTITDGQIIALGTGAFATTRTMTETITTASSYIFICYPASFGAATFVVNGFPDAGWTLVTRSFVNASGGAVSYNIYQHTLATIGDFTVQVQ
jgi:hypothetical protein